MPPDRSREASRTNRGRRSPAPWCRRSARRRRSRSAIGAAGSSSGSLSPGPYLVRAHLSGFVASRGQVIEVRPSARASSSIALRHASAGGAPPSYPVLAAGVGAPAAAAAPAEAAGASGAASAPESAGETGRAPQRRSRRARVATASRAPRDPEGRHPSRRPVRTTSRSVGSGRRRMRSAPAAARLATNFFADTPFSGQVNLLTTGSFDSPQQLFSADNFAHSTAYLALGAPVGGHADWTARAALTQGDIASWIVAGEYTTRAPARHRYDIGLSYSTQRYEGGNFAALRERHRRQPERRRALCVRHVFDHAGPHADLRRPLRALRLSRRPQPLQPARRADGRTRGALPRQHACSRAARSRRAPRSSCRAWTAASGCRRSGRSRRW